MSSLKKRRSFTISIKLEAVTYAESHSGAEAARYFGVDEKRIREWKKQRPELERQGMGPIGKKRRNLEGQGKKKASEDLETEIFEWILERRERGEKVSRRMIQDTAKELYPTVDDQHFPTFKASNGWVQKFMLRNGLSMRHRTTVAQKDPDDLCAKLVSFVAYVSHVREKFNISDKDAVAMDETSVWFDCLTGTTVEVKGKKTVTIKSTGHEKAHASVMLAAKGGGTKLPPFIVFKGQKRKVKAMQGTPGIFIASTTNGWFNSEVTKDWIDKVIGHLSTSKRLLVWDSYRCHINEEVKGHLKQFNTEMAVIPGGCTKYIQAPDVSWNKPFKAKMSEFYDAWMSNDENKDYTKGGNLKAVSMELLTEWVKAAWESISDEIIKKSFRICALTTATNGSEDTEILCFQEGEPCRNGWDMLVNYRDSDSSKIITMIDEDDDELEKNELVVYISDDDEEDG